MLQTHIWFGPQGVGKLEIAIKKTLQILSPEFSGITPQAEKGHFLNLCKEGKAQLIQYFKGLSYSDLIEKHIATENNVYYTEGSILRAIKSAAQMQSPYVFIISSVEVSDFSMLLGPLSRGLLQRNVSEPIWLESQQDYIVIPDNFYFFCTYNTSRDIVFNVMTPSTQILPQSIKLSPKSMILSLWREFNGFDNQETYSAREKNLYDLLGVSEHFISSQNDIYNKIAEGFNESGVWDLELFTEFSISEGDFTGVRLDKLLLGLNRRILNYLDAGSLIGHKKFIHIDSIKSLNLLFAYQILPFLQFVFLTQPNELLDILNYKTTDNNFLVPITENASTSSSRSLVVNPKLFKGEFTKKDFEGLY